MSEHTAVYWARNPFQFDSLLHLFGVFPKSVWCPANNQLADHIRERGFPVCTPRDIRRLSNRKFFFITQGGVRRFMLRNLDAKIYMMQYGYGKSAYNYGAWRTLADIVFVYGELAREHMSERAHAVVIGDTYAESNVMPVTASAFIDCVLYAPTHGSLSSVTTYLAALKVISEQQRLLVKLHHNDQHLQEALKIELPQATFCSGEYSLHQLINSSRVVLTDYGGAPLETFRLGRPQILLNLRDKLISDNKKINKNSPEIKFRHQLGVEVANSDELLFALDTLLAGGDQAFSQMDLRTRMYYGGQDGLDIFRDTILRDLEGALSETLPYQRRRRIARLLRRFSP